MLKYFSFIFLNYIFFSLKKVVVLYFPGINDQCDSNDIRVLRIKFYTNYKVICINYGSNSLSNWPKILDKACTKLKNIRKQLVNGWIAFGESQGGLLAKLSIQYCDEGNYAKGLLTLSSPLMGISSIPKYNEKNPINFSLHICEYKFFRKFITPCSYYWKYNDIKYNEDSMIGEFNNLKYLNKQYKNRIINLERILITINTDDKTVIPRNSGHLAYYNSNKTLIKYEDSKYYKEDNLGLRQMFNQQKLFKCIFDGEHRNYNKFEFFKIIKPFLNYNKKLSQKDYLNFIAKCNFKLFK